MNPTVNCPCQETKETSTPYKTCWECRVNDERPTRKKNTTIEWGDGGKIGNKNNNYKLREKFSPGPGFEPGSPASSNPGPGDNFSFNLLIYDLSDGHSEN